MNPRERSGSGSASDVGGHQHPAHEQSLGNYSAAGDSEDDDCRLDERATRGRLNSGPDASPPPCVPLTPGVEFRTHHQPFAVLGLFPYQFITNISEADLASSLKQSVLKGKAAFSSEEFEYLKNLNILDIGKDQLLKGNQIKIAKYKQDFLKLLTNKI